jgi:hypothetical protein
MRLDASWVTMIGKLYSGTEIDSSDARPVNRYVSVKCALVIPESTRIFVVKDIIVLVENENCRYKLIRRVCLYRQVALWG